MSENRGTTEQLQTFEGFRSNFLLGRISATAEAIAALGRIPYDLLARHAVNDHGTVTRKERAANQASMQGSPHSPVGGPIFSRYRADPTSVRSAWITIRTDDTWSETRIDIE